MLITDFEYIYTCMEFLPANYCTPRSGEYTARAESYANPAPRVGALNCNYDAQTLTNV